MKCSLVILALRLSHLYMIYASELLFSILNLQGSPEIYNCFLVWYFLFKYGCHDVHHLKLVLLVIYLLYSQMNVLSKVKKGYEYVNCQGCIRVAHQLCFYFLYCTLIIEVFLNVTVYICLKHALYVITYHNLVPPFNLELSETADIECS